jgi:hypothetical protein
MDVVSAEHVEGNNATMQSGTGGNVALHTGPCGQPCSASV